MLRLPYILKPIALQQDKGVGDTLERVIKKTGLASLAKGYEKITGKPCGCLARRDRLNSEYPY